MYYTTQTKDLAKQYNIQPRDVHFCMLVAAGAEKAEAYYTVYCQAATTRATSHLATVQAEELLRNHPGMKVLINKLKHRRPARQQQDDTADTTPDEDLTSRDGLIQFMRRNLSQVTGKDALAAAQTLAKLEGYDKEKPVKEEERRTFYLPYVSDCRHCTIMQTFQEIQAEEEQE